MVKMITKRGITQSECHWLDDNIAPGTVVYSYTGCTYGCIGPAGKAVTLVDGVEPFFELPEDSLMPIQKAFRARISARSGALLYLSEPCPTRLGAARAAFLARPKAKECSTSYCMDTGAEGHMRILWHGRSDIAHD